MNREKAPLYRKYNKRAWGYHHSSFRDDRNSKEVKYFEGAHRSMPRSRAGYDYTPLFRFLLSKVGQEWDGIFSEAVSRLDKQVPIFWIVDLHFKNGARGVTGIGESTYYSKLTVRDGILEIADREAPLPVKYCNCCTHTFNGVPY